MRIIVRESVSNDVYGVQETKKKMAIIQINGTFVIINYEK